MELWVMREHGGQEATNGVAQARVEVVQDHLWFVMTHSTTVLLT